MNDVTPVRLTYLGTEDYQKGIITMLKIENNQIAIHRQLKRDSIIDGDDLIIKVESEELKENTDGKQ